ncbi:uncharacterized protein [Lepeophtheirus salmonis]|uniref:uncharacterized protein n=1 Tax=Lepeophtheirus salmonis TaxID=72036 RepID=UPI001AE2F7E1|nr:beta/gamma crystallin domain-containing protein 1-like [Lepeophtheirus salmonis]
MKTLFVTVLFIGLSFGIPRQSEDVISYSAKLYSETGFTGYSTEIRDYVKDLSTHNFEDFSKSAIINGVWIFYENTDYNQFEFGKRSFYGWGKDHKISSFGQLNRALSSVRYSGAGENMKYSTINFYEGSGFMGNEQYFYSDTPSLNHDNFGESIIVTGCDPWTLYEERSYRGDRICVYPASTQKCEPGFYIQPQDFGHFVNKVSSVRKGCFSKKVFKGVGVPANSTRMFTPKQQH